MKKSASEMSIVLTFTRQRWRSRPRPPPTTPDPTEAALYPLSPASDPFASKRQPHASRTCPVSPEAARAAAAMMPAAAPRGASAGAATAAAATTTSRSHAAATPHFNQQYCVFAYSPVLSMCFYCNFIV
jgi:hypothetical protein